MSPQSDPFALAWAPGAAPPSFEEHMLRSAEALGYAVVRHGAQKYGSEPYQVHLLAVAKALYDLYLTRPGPDGAVTAFHLDAMEAVLRDDEADLCRECSFKRTVSALKREEHAVAVKLADRLVNMRKSTQERSTHLNMYVREYPGFRKLLHTANQHQERLFQALDEAFEAAQKRAK